MNRNYLQVQFALGVILRTGQVAVQSFMPKTSLVIGAVCGAELSIFVGDLVRATWDKEGLLLPTERRTSVVDIVQIITDRCTRAAVVLHLPQDQNGGAHHQR